MPIFPLGRARVDVGPADVGRRLSIRYREDMLTDAEAVGVLYRWSGGLDEGTIRIRRRNGAEQGIKVRDILAMRVVPPEASAYSMMRLAQDGWPPMEAREIGPWVMRASRGATSRANSVRVAGLPDKPLASVLDKVRHWYGERNLVPKLQLTTPNGMRSMLVDLGWTESRPSRFMAAGVPRLLELTAESQHREDLDVRVTSSADDEWLGLIDNYGPATAEEYRRALSTGLPGAFVSCRNSEGTLLGIGHAVLQGHWCGATTIRTSPDARRAGIATAVTGRLARWASDNGARHWYLQFYEDNAAALSFYERLGFSTHHRYEYRSPGPADLSSDAAL